MPALHHDAGLILAGRALIATIEPQRAADIYIAAGWRPVVAVAVAAGALARIETTQQLAALVRLITKGY